MRHNPSMSQESVSALGSVASREARAFLVRSAELLHAHGTPTDRLEETLEACARRLGVRGQFLSTPTSFLAAFEDGDEQRLRLLRVQPGEIHLGKLVEFDAVFEEVESGRCTPRAGQERMDAIHAAPPRFGGVWTTLAFAFASAGAAVFFAGGPREILVSWVLGLSCGFLAVFTGRRARTTRVFEPSASFLAAFLSVAAAHHLAPLSDRIVTLSALIVLVPGLSLTVAMNELATRHLVAGTARLAGALSIFLTIAFGVALGRRLGELAFGAIALGVPPVRLSEWALAPALVGTSLAFLVLFQARKRDLGWILTVGALGFLSARVGGEFLGAELGAFAGALVVGIASHLCARLRRLPASVTLVPGILLLVPGSIGYQSLDFFIAQDALAGMQTAFRTTLVAAALVGGLLFANVLLPPRRNL
jgi:uncharacterized membrane protein YjjP (DUF1212 family)